MMGDGDDMVLGEFGRVFLEDGVGEKVLGKIDGSTLLLSFLVRHRETMLLMISLCCPLS